MTALHKVTSRAEFSRRSDVLRDHEPNGRRQLQAVGAWLLLWLLHSDSDGRVRRSPAEVAGLLGVSRPQWQRLADLLEAAGLLVLDDQGAGYLVPDPARLEGFTHEHRGAGGFRRLHRVAFAEHVATRAGADQGRAAGSARLAVLGVFGWVVLRHTDATGSRVHTAAWTELQQLLDSKTARAYLAALSPVLVREGQSGLRYVGRTVLEGAGRPQGLSLVPSPRQVVDRAAAAVSGPPISAASVVVPVLEPVEDVELLPAGAAGADLGAAAGPVAGPLDVSTVTRTDAGENENGRRHAGGRSSGQLHQPTPQPPVPVERRSSRATPGVSRHPLLEQLLDALAGFEPALVSLRTSRRRRALLSAALHAVDGDLAGLLEQLTERGELGTADHPAAALVRHRLPRAVEALCRAQGEPARQARAAQQAAQWDQARRERERQQAAAQRVEVAQLRDQREDDLDAMRAAVGEDYPVLLEQAAVLVAPRAPRAGLTERGVLLPAVRAVLRGQDPATASGCPTSGQERVMLAEVPAQMLAEAVRAVLADPLADWDAGAA